MPAPLLETKLHVPRLRRGLIARPRLIERLNRGVKSTLTLVSAPPGFGKTTLLTEWLAAVEADGPSVAWLSLDQRDNDPALFWAYVVAALDAAARGPEDGLAGLQPPQPPTGAGLAGLLNDLGGLAHDVVLVLDDYHVIEAREVQDAVGFLLEHLPPQVRLVIAGRADPPLPLARLRGRGDLVEIRAADLRFTPGEAAAYLNGAMGLTLTAQDVDALEGRTEGWIAALQLAALSMQGRDDVAAFIAGFTGDDRYIVDYLAEEVLQRQPEDVQLFLLQTSILDRLCGTLCDAISGQDGGSARLVALERRNLFLVPLDDRRQWYRYHQLFADVLQTRLLAERPDDIADLHRRASAWYQGSGEMSEAIRHSLAGEDFERAADLVELSIPAMRRSRGEAAVHNWLRALPDEVVRARPVLCVGFAGALLTIGEFDGVEPRLRDAERWLDATGALVGGQGTPAQMVVVDDDEFTRIPAMIGMYRAALAMARGDIPAVARHAERALGLTGDEDRLWRASAAALLGLANWTSGDLEAGHRAYTECVAGLRRAGHVADTFGCAIALADIRRTQGRLVEAMRTYEQTLHLAAPHGGSALRGTADMYVGMSEIHREHGDLPAAIGDLLRSQELGDHLGLPQNPYRWRIAMARVHEAEGDMGGALELLDDAERVYVGDFFPNVRPIPALRARLWIAQGQVDQALGWAQEHGLSAEDELSYLHEFEHITLARALLAQSTNGAGLDDACRLLERLLHAAQTGGRAGSVIEILILQALTHQVRDDVPTALVALHAAMALAEPERYVRTFVDEGAPMAALLRAAAQETISAGYVRRLLAALPRRVKDTAIGGVLIEPLTERELEVLRLLGTDLDGPDIARHLVVSLNTVRTHTKNIYSKLGVTNRRAAVRRAGELDILVSGHSSRAGSRRLP
jgi:LuxR family maltose regulon positive regulatory protein